MRSIQVEVFSEFMESQVGLQQGDPCSPILFMLFVNDIVDNINSDLEGIFTIDELKLFLLLYADDQVLFTRITTKCVNRYRTLLQYMGLKINSAKTKAVIFEKGRYTDKKFYIYGQEIENVPSFKYLGTNFFKNGNWHRSQKNISQHAHSHYIIYFKF